jgi:DNA polymerase III subunit delta'
MPEALMLELGWPLDAKAQDDIDNKKRKPSREIRVEAMREAIEFAQRSNARGQGKVILIYPAERMNTVTANALLKNLEEPAEGVRFILVSENAHALLPTVRSRCLHHAMHWPAREEALSWLVAQGLAPADAEVLLRAAGGRPEEAQHYLRSERGANFWRQAPAQLARGEFVPESAGDATALLDTLHKLCHDLLCLHAGAEPRFFATADLAPCQGQWDALSTWSQQLQAAQRSVNHPFHAGLQLQALVEQARLALHS